MTRRGGEQLLERALTELVAARVRRWLVTRHGGEQLLERALTELVAAFDLPHGRKRRRRIALAIRDARVLVTPEPMLPSEWCTVCGEPAHDCMGFDKAGEIVDPRCWAHLPGGGDHG